MQAVDDQLRVPLSEVMWGDDAELLKSTEFAQPALFAIEVALAALWQSWGVAPDVVIGHSVGEITAACVAGTLSLPDAARVVAARGRLMARLPTGGVMVAVTASEAEVAPLLTEGVSVAAVNGPKSVVMSGERAAVGAVRTVGGRRSSGASVGGVARVSLAADGAHGRGVLAVVAGVSAGEPRIGLVSNVTGQLAGAGYGSPRTGSGTCASRCVSSTACGWPSR